MFELRKLSFKAHLILDVKKIFGLQKPHCKNLFLVVSRSNARFGFEHAFFLRVRSGAHEKSGT